MVVMMVVVMQPSVKWDSRMWGGVMLIMGTALGGGVLAQPLTNATSGFIYSCAYLVLIWLVMTACALVIAEVNSRCPLGSHFLSMAQHTLGPFGQWLTACCYLCLLYALVAAYIAAGSEILLGSLRWLGVGLSPLSAMLLFVTLFGAVVFSGMSRLDYVNRLLMVAKALIFMCLVWQLGQYIAWSELTKGQPGLSAQSGFVMITAFGFAIIIPSLRCYLQDDMPKLRRVIITGSLLPLVIYILWHGIIFGVLDSQNLYAAAENPQPYLALSRLLSEQLSSPYLVTGLQVFAGLCLLTSFVGVALSLADFIFDSLSHNYSVLSRSWIFLLTFMPPMLVVWLVPSAFLWALSYGGMFCWLLHVTIPLWMYYRLKTKDGGPYRYIHLIVLALLSCALLVL